MADMHLGPSTTIDNEKDEIPVSTRWHRAHGRQTRRQRAIQQQLLTPPEEKAIVDYVIRLYRNGHPARVKHLREFARTILRRRAKATGQCSPALPGKDWPQAFYKRHPELQAARMKAIDWQRHEKNIRAKVERWFEMMSVQLNERGILQENVYNMDETGVLLSDLNTVKVLVERGGKDKRRGVGLKRTQITAVECISADGRCLPPLIIFPAKTLRSTWVSHEMPDWHYACNETGYMNSELNLYWVKKVFEPATRPRAKGKPRVLIIDGFGTHEAPEVLTFCLENDIIVCRQPSHATHKLQPCDVGVFGPLKTAYREQVERLYRNGAGTVNKAHFTSLYSCARDIAMTSRNIRSGWAKAGLFPWNPAKVLDDMQDIPADEPINATTYASSVHPLRSPLLLRTPTNVVSLVALQRKLEERPEAAAGIDPYLQKLVKGAMQAMGEKEEAIAAKSLLLVREQELVLANDEKIGRQRVKEKKIGEAKVMSHADIVEAQKTREQKDADNERKKRTKGAKRAEKKPRVLPEVMAEEAEPAVEIAAPADFSAYCSVFPVRECVINGAVGTPRPPNGNSGFVPPDSNVWSEDKQDEVRQWQAPVAYMY